MEILCKVCHGIYTVYFWHCSLTHDYVEYYISDWKFIEDNNKDHTLGMKI